MKAGDQPNVRKRRQPPRKINPGKLRQKLHPPNGLRNHSALARHAEFLDEGRAQDGDRTEGDRVGHF